MGRETSTWRIEMSHQDPAARSASVNGSGKTAHQRSQNTRIVPGPSVSRIRRNPVGPSVAANPLSSSVNPIPAAVASRLAGRAAALLRRFPLRTGRAAQTASRLGISGIPPLPCRAPGRRAARLAGTGLRLTPVSSRAHR